jgi:hypothetical protein
VVGRGDLEAGDGQRGRYGVAERPVLPGKPGNAGGGKGPWFKSGAERSKAREIGVTLGNSAEQEPASFGRSLHSVNGDLHMEGRRELRGL